MTSPKPSLKSKTNLMPNNESFRLLFASHPTPMWVYDLKTLAFLDVNDAALEKYGYTRDEFLALTIKDIRPVEDVTRLLNNLEQKSAALHHSGEWRHCRKNGQIIDVEITTHILDFEGQKAVLVMAQDITERKRAEQVLHEKFKLQEQLTKIIETAPGGLFSVQRHADGTITMPYVSPIWEELWGLKQEDVRENSKLVFDLIHPDDIEHVLKISKESATDVCLLYGEFRILNPVKGEIWVEGRSTPVRQSDGSILWHGVTTDITERKRTEEALKESEKRFATIFRANPAAIEMTRLDDGHLVDVNAAWQRMTGYVHTEVVGQTPQELNLWVYPEQRERLTKMLDEKGKAHGEMQLRQKSGEVRDLLMSADLMELTGKRYLLTMAQDITESKRAAEKLHESEEKYRAVVDKANDGIMIGQDGVIKFSNSSLAAMLGYQVSEMEGVEFRKFLPPENMELLLERYEKRLAGLPIPSLYETALLHKSGRKIPVEVNAGILQFEGKTADLVIMRDITVRKQAEAQQQNFYNMLNASLNEIYIFDAQALHFEFVSAGAINNLGYTLDELRRMTPLDLKPEITPETFAALINPLRLGTAPVVNFETVHRRADGSLYPVEVHLQLFSQSDHPVFMAVILDITERKQTGKALHESAIKLMRSQQIGKLGSWDWNIVGNSLDWSDEVYQIWGVGKDFNLTFENIAGMIHPDDQELNSKMVQEFLAQSNKGGFEFRIVCPDGTIKHIYQSIEVMRATDGQPIKMFGIMQDITKRKQAEISLRESQAKLQSIMDYSPALISIKDLNGNVILANRGFATLDTPPLNELIGKNVFDIFPREVAEQLWNNDLAALQAKAPVRSEEVVKHKDGIWHTYLTVKFPIYLQSDQPFGICAISNDISERKQAEETLRETSERLTHMLANSPTVIYALKVEGGKAIPNWISDNIHAILGFTAKDGLQPEWWSQQIYPDDRAEALASLENLFDDFYQHEYRFLHKDGSLIWLHDEHRVLRDEDNKPREVIGAWTDITERKQAEELLQGYNAHLEDEVLTRTSELRETQEKLVRNEKLAVLGQLAGGVGHELRNPLAVINNALYYLKLVGADSSEKVKEYLGIIETEAHTAEKIITDLLDFARIKSVDVEAVSALKLTERVLNRYPAPKAVSIRLEIPEDLPMLYADPRQIEQVLGNLIINACQAMSASGELTITAHREQEMIAIAVKDTGVGIPPENMKMLFEPLFTTKAKGIGLGLAVSQKLAEANGGRIEVQSEAGKGSTFTVYLPVFRSS